MYLYLSFNKRYLTSIPGRSEMDAEPLTITVKEAAKLLGISRSLAYELVHKGEIPALRLGEKCLVILLIPLKQMLSNNSWRKKNGSFILTND